MKPSVLSLPEWSRTWAEHRLDQALSDISCEQWNELGDWLAALPIERPKMPAKLHKLTMAQALEASVRWHEDIAGKAERIRDEQASFGGDPSAVEVLADGGQGWRWVKVTSPEGLDYEGNAMGHCVGSGNYDTGVTIISLRDKDNMPHCTIEWDEDSRSVEQVQGRANGPVDEKYHESLVSFVNGLEPLAVQGAGQFGHVLVEGRLIHCNNLPDGLTLETLDLAGCTGLSRLPDKLNIKELYLPGCTSLTQLPDRLNVEALNLMGCTGIRQLPDGLTAKYINLVSCTGLTHLPEELNTQRLYLNGCTSLTNLPNGLILEELDLSHCNGLTHLPDGLTTDVLDLYGCTGITHLPDRLGAHRLYLNGCTGLTKLPDRLNVEYITLVGCTGLTQLPEGLSVKILDLSGCNGLIHLPDGLTAKRISLNGCTGITHLPNGLGVDYLDIGGCTGLTSLPSDLNLDCRIRGGDHLIRRSTARI